MTNNKTVLSWLDEMKALLNPDNVMWIDGSEEQLESLRAIAVPQLQILLCLFLTRLQAVLIPVQNPLSRMLWMRLCMAEQYLL